MTSEAKLPDAAGPTNLTAVLRRLGVLDARKVVDVEVLRSSATILSHVYRLRPVYDREAGDAPATLFLKAGLVDRPGGPWSGGRQEVAFYKMVAPATPRGLLPYCYEAHFDETDGTWHLLLEDLAGTHAAATPWPLPPSLPDCERIMRAKARFQAAWWDDPRLGTTIGSWWSLEAAEAAARAFESELGAFLADFGDRVSAERQRLYERFIAATPHLRERYFSHRHMTVVQGDSHVWNCFLAKDGADDTRLFDWDAWRLDIGTADLANMMASQWYPDLRGRVEHRLLDAFHEALVAEGVAGYDRRALQDDYRFSVLWQITTPVWQHARGIPPYIWWNNFERIHLAVEDLDCRELL